MLPMAGSLKKIADKRRSFTCTELRRWAGVLMRPDSQIIATQQEKGASRTSRNAKSASEFSDAHLQFYELSLG
jgi:hypothetical protein